MAHPLGAPPLHFFFLFFFFFGQYETKIQRAHKRQYGRTHKPVGTEKKKKRNTTSPGYIEYIIIYTCAFVGGGRATAQTRAVAPVGDTTRPDGRRSAHRRACVHRDARVASWVFRFVFFFSCGRQPSAARAASCVLRRGVRATGPRWPITRAERHDAAARRAPSQIGHVDREGVVVGDGQPVLPKEHDVADGAIVV